MKIDSENVKLDLTTDGLVDSVYHSSDLLTGESPSDILTGEQGDTWQLKDGMGKDTLEGEPGYATFIPSQGGNVGLIKDLVTNGRNTEPLPGLQMGNPMEKNGMVDHAKSLIAAPGDTRIPTPSIM